MLLSIIIKSIPRSPRALLTFVVMLGSTSLLFSALTELFTPSGANAAMSAVKFVVGLAIGLPATALFYYWQHQDQTKTHEMNRLDVLNNYAEAEKRDRIYKQSVATPVFTSQGAPIGSHTQGQPIMDPDTPQAADQSAAVPTLSTTERPFSQSPPLRR